MLKMKLSVYHLINTLFYATIGLVIGFQAHKGLDVMIGEYHVDPALSWTVVGLSFIMALFSLKFLK